MRPWFDVEAFQQRIDDRVGLNKDGQPIIKLIWGQDVFHHLFDEELPRYWLRRQGSTYWTIPRWMFEKRLEREQYVDGWNANRYALRDPSQGSPSCGDCGWGGEPKLIKGQLYCSACVSTNLVGGAVIDKGPPPDEYFVYMMEAAKHEGATGPDGWPQCCTRAFYGATKFGSQHARCWGEYRPPSDFDLEVISQAVRVMESEKFKDPYRPLTPVELLEAELAANKQLERAEEQIHLAEQEIMAENMRLFIRKPHTVDFGAPGTRDPFDGFGVPSKPEGEAGVSNERAVARLVQSRKEQHT